MQAVVNFDKATKDRLQRMPALNSDLIEVRPIPAVVQADDIRFLRDLRNAEAADEFLQGYLGFDERSRHALDASVHSLSGKSGGAWFFNGVFGSGKSHLLGALTLLADCNGHAAFAEIHPHLVKQLDAFAPRLVVHFSLDEYPATRFSLEEIFWREVRAEWRRCGLPVDPMRFDSLGPRGESFANIESALASQGLTGLVVCIDELSLFLSGREHRALQNDAAFLQFLGQRARRRTTGAAPLWVFAALQKTIEDIGDLDAYVIAQIRDRYTTLPLSLAHLPSLIEKRLIIRKDAEVLAKLNASAYDALLAALPRLDFDRDEWQRLYPFHPATISLLESAAGRFLSRTRSAVLFCSEAIKPKSPAEQRISTEALFDFVEPELGSHPDLKNLQATWRNWRDNLGDIADNETETLVVRQLMKTLLLYKIAGTSPSVAQLAHAIALDARLPGEGNYEYARLLLEKLRERAGSLIVERRDGTFNDRYTIDFGARVGEMARRFTANALQTLPAGDSRIGAYVLSCCHEESLPLASLQGAHSLATLWRNTPRTVHFELGFEPPAADVLANRFAALSSPGGDDFALWIVPPFPASPGSAGTDMATQWREAMREASKTNEDARWRGALMWWLPRAPSRDEWQLAREAAAQHLLQQDPQLKDNRRGRAVIEFLKNGQAERELVLARMAARLLREGTIASGAGVVVDAAELAGAESWGATLEALAELVLSGVFPRADKVTPRLRVLTPASVESLCLETLRRPVDAPYFSASLERTVRAIAAPLGVAAEEKGRWKVASGNPELSREICEFVSAIEGGASVAALETHFAKSEWGLNPDQTRLCLCALLRSGELAGFDTRGEQLTAREIGMPLRRAVHTVRPGRLLDAASWKAVQKWLALLAGEKLGALSFREQERAHALLANWRAETVSQVELAQARLHQLRRNLGHDIRQWPRSEEAQGAVTQLLHVTAEAPAYEVLNRLAAQDIVAAKPFWQAWQYLTQKLDERQGPLLQAHAFLTHPELAVPTELQSERTELLAHFEKGESLLYDETLSPAFENWRTQYAYLYTNWHRAQNAPERFISLRRLAAGDTARALLCLGQLTCRDFPAGAEIQTLVADELAKSCSRDGALHHAPICGACRLRYGQRLTLLAPREIENKLASAVETLRTALLEPAVNNYLQRSEEGSALLHWGAAGQPGEALLPLLNSTALRQLDEAFRPRRQVERSWQALQNSLQTCRTRTEYETAFSAWLDGGEGLQGDDEVIVNAES